MNTIREIQKINEEELKIGIAGTNASWHEKYSNSQWVYIGNIDTTLTEGDMICVLSQYGEIEDFNMIRDQETGISKGFAFCKYEDTKSCVLAVDNFIGIKLCQRSIRIDHVENYKLPKHILERTNNSEEVDVGEKDNEIGDNTSSTTQQKQDGSLARSAPGHAYVGKELANEYTIGKGMDLFAPPSPKRQQQQQEQHDNRNNNNKELDEEDDSREERKKSSSRKRKKEEKKEKKHRKSRSNSKKSTSKKSKKEYKDKKKRRRRSDDNSDHSSDDES